MGDWYEEESGRGGFENEKVEMKLGGVEAMGKEMERLLEEGEMWGDM